MPTPMSFHSVNRCLLAALFSVVLTLSGIANASEAYDLVISGGRVIDPETAIDAVRDVGITGGQITAISEQTLRGKRMINATGKVVAPGFIDIHTHTPTLLGQHLNLLDGVTTQLDLEAGAYPVAFYGEHYRGGAQLNYGSSVSHSAIRLKVMDGIDQPYLFTGRKVAYANSSAWIKPADPEQIEQMRVLLNKGLDQGGLGIGVLLDYMTSAVTPAELRMLFDVAGARHVPIFVHARRGMPGDPAGLKELIGLAKETRAPLLICHITHNAMGGIGDWLAMIDEANAGGANIAAETLTYAAGGTGISSDVFRRRNWQAIFDITYKDVQWVATGEWMTKESWEKYAREQPAGMVNHHYVKEAWLHSALRWPQMMISSDALPVLDIEQLSNPNVAGTYSRLLGHYVRDLSVLPLMQALAKSSLYPARWLEQASPGFKKKGRLQAGADADLVVFDAQTIAANAIYGAPYEPPTGMHHVVVGGRVIVENGKRIEGRYPGKHLLGPTP